LSPLFYGVSWDRAPVCGECRLGNGAERELREQYGGHGCFMKMCVDTVVSCGCIRMRKAIASDATLLEMGWGLRALWKVSLKNVAKESRRRGTHIRSLRKEWYGLGCPVAMHRRSAGGRLGKPPRRSAELDPRIVSGAPA
jgi:hypothetical protein